MPPTSAPAAYIPGTGDPLARSTRACSSMRRPPIVCVTAARTRTAMNGGSRTLLAAGQARTLDELADGAVRRRLAQAGRVDDVPGRAFRLPRDRLDEVVLRPG